MNAELLSSSKRLIRMDILTPQQTWLSGNDRAASFELHNGRRQRGGIHRARLVGTACANAAVVPAATERFQTIGGARAWERT